MKKSVRHDSAPAGPVRWLFPVAILAAAVTAGMVLGGLTSQAGAEDGSGAVAPAAAVAPVPTPAPQAAPAPGKPDSISRVKIDLEGAPAVGPQDAPVTLVEFTDYQCPFCRRAHNTLNQVRQKYGDKLRVVYLQNPLSFHKEAPLAAKAALAAGEQGRFNEMHDMLLANTDLSRAAILRYAQSLALDVPAFQAAIDSDRFDARLQQDQAQAARLGASATPFFFVNGRAIRGAQPITAFDAIIQEELAGDLPPTKWVAQVEAPPQRPQEDPNKIYKIDLADSIRRGPADAPVTLVEFTAFQCGFCARSQATIAQIMEAYPGKVQHVVKYKPLRDPVGALASLAADRQGKYWEYRQLLFENQRAMTEENLRVWAKQLGLDVDQFERDRNDPALLAVVQRNARQAGELGVSGTPTFFINGKKVVGAQPFATFKQIIDQQMAVPVAAAN